MNSLNRLLVLSVVWLVLVNAHGRMTKPSSRGILAGTKNVGAENAPCACPGNTCDSEFVCRNDPAAPVSSYVALTAGGSTNLQWNFPAAHNGDCFAYITYDVDLPPTQMKWFKVQAWFDCKSNQNTDMPLNIPSYLPTAAHVIVRWEWYGLHVRDNGIIEFYSQCFDASITGTAAGSPLPTPQVTIPGHLPTNAKANYRDSYDPSSPQYMTGPPVATLGGAPYTTPTSTTPPPSTTPTPTPSTPTPTPSTPTPTPSTPTPTPSTPTPTPTPSTPTPNPTSPASDSNNGNSTNSEQPCTANTDCSSGVCQMNGFCLKKSSSLGSSGIAAIVFAGLVVLVILVVVGFFAVNRKEVPYMVPFKGRI